MQRLFQVCLIAIVAVALASPVVAQDDAKKKRKKGAKRGVAAQLMGRLEKANLSDEQKAKIKAIVEKHTEKVQAAQKKVNELVGADGRKKMQAAMKKAREEGKKGKDLQAAAMAALGLTGDKVGAYKEAQAAAAKVRAEMTAAVAEVLTPEQRKAAKVRAGNAKKGAKKPGAKKANAKKKKKDADK